MPQIIFTADPFGNIIYFNERWEEYTGATAQESLGKNWNLFHHPDDIKSVTKTWKESITNGTPYQIEFRLRGNDGQFRWFLARALPMRDEHGKINKWIGTNTDIHEQKVL
jgi:PAS domain S-box-containing protein